jgi:3-methyl-2-oxobutanoate hydroxymethyltransferase
MRSICSQRTFSEHAGHVPRHAKQYRDFTAEFARPQLERVAAFTEFAGDVKDGAYPAAGHSVRIADDQFGSFLDALPDDQKTSRPDSSPVPNARPSESTCRSTC